MDWSIFNNRNIGFAILVFCFISSLIVGNENEKAYKNRIVIMLYAIGLMLNG